MTLQQLKYAVEIARFGSITKAAEHLFISQPSLSNAIMELENEIGITIFNRTNKGITISTEGAEFLGYAKQVIEQTELLESRYSNKKITKQSFSVSTQHYAFAVSAFVNLIKGNEELLDLEKAGIKIIQIDEAALREKLPIRKEDWKKEYLDWAIPAFRLTAAKVKPETQIHTHMCYSEFSDIIKEIQDMDIDAITIEAARSDFSLLDFLKKNNFRPEIGPGVYDIHSPRVPSEEELEQLIKIMINKLDINKLWINPDCGLKTRGIEENKQSLINMIKATRTIREYLKK